MNSGRRTYLYGASILGLVLVVILAAGLALSRRTAAVPLPAELRLDQAAAREAIDYGVSGREDFLVDFLRPWHVSLGYGAGLGTATIYTPWLSLAVLARNAALADIRINEAELIALAHQESRQVRFETTLYGHAMGFSRGYRALVLAGGEEFAPLRSAIRGYEQAREYTIFAFHDFYFPPAILLTGDPALTLRVIPPGEEAEPLDFVFERAALK